MKIEKLFFIIVAALTLFLAQSCARAEDTYPGKGHCFVGAFLGDNPTSAEIKGFKDYFGKGPSPVMLFVDWNKYPDTAALDKIYSLQSVAMITWEPWEAETKAGIDYDGLLNGKYDRYIMEFALRLKKINKDVYMRFAHEMNGDWYPWSGKDLGPEKYKAIYRYVFDIFRREGALNVKWVFAINWEDVPVDNYYAAYYPGDGYADYIGIDGYNWGDTKPWAKWRTFSEIFSNSCKDAVKRFNKPVMITEFGSSSSGGDKEKWIKDAIQDVRNMKDIKAVILFNVDKETDWAFLPGTSAGKALKDSLANDFFK
jgi:beta-mannanase